MKKILIAILVICASFVLCGASWFNDTKVVIDTENNQVYQYYTVDTILSEFTNDSKEARKKYQGEQVLLSGTIVSIGKNGKNIILSGTTSDGTIDCSYDKELRDIALAYQVGEHVALYGQMTVDAIDKEIHLKAVKIVKVPVSIRSKEMYYLLDGSSFNKTNATKVTLHNGGVEYYIPSTWTKQGICHNIVDENIGSMEGYQYVLNQLETKETAPESLFVCYFDNKTQLSDYLNDSDEAELIEKAIVENILGSVGTFPSKEVKTYYGSKYTYYIGSFKSTLDTGSGYHTEFVFQEDGEDGIVVMLYVYKETTHISDVLFVSRFLEIK